jgi:hypothetical protein
MPEVAVDGAFVNVILGRLARPVVNVLLDHVRIGRVQPGLSGGSQVTHASLACPRAACIVESVAGACGRRRRIRSARGAGGSRCRRPSASVVSHKAGSTGRCSPLARPWSPQSNVLCVTGLRDPGHERRAPRGADTPGCALGPSAGRQARSAISDPSTGGLRLRRSRAVCPHGGGWLSRVPSVRDGALVGNAICVTT